MCYFPTQATSSSRLSTICGREEAVVDVADDKNDGQGKENTYCILCIWRLTFISIINIFIIECDPLLLCPMFIIVFECVQFSSLNTHN